MHHSLSIVARKSSTESAMGQARSEKLESAYLVVGLDVELDLLAGKCSYSINIVSLALPSLQSLIVRRACNLLDLHLVYPSLTRTSRRRVYALVCQVRAGLERLKVVVGILCSCDRGEERTWGGKVIGSEVIALCLDAKSSGCSS